MLMTALQIGPGFTALSSVTGGSRNKDVFSLSMAPGPGRCPGAWPVWYRAAAACVVPRTHTSDG